MDPRDDLRDWGDGEITIDVDRTIGEIVKPERKPTFSRPQHAKHLERQIIKLVGGKDFKDATITMNFLKYVDVLKSCPEHGMKDTTKKPSKII
jgi:hypothetical protein